MEDGQEFNSPLPENDSQKRKYSTSEDDDSVLASEVARAKGLTKKPKPAPHACHSYLPQVVSSKPKHG